MSGTKKIIYQGETGSNSHTACIEVYPNYEAVACPTFEDCFSFLANGDAALAMIPIENSVAGRVADIHHLLPQSSLHIIGEFFLPIHFNIVAPQGATLEGIKSIQSHIMALGQCRKIIRKLGLKTVAGADTAGSARQIAELGDQSLAALAPKMAAEAYDLDILAENVEDETHNMTRFIILSNKANDLSSLKAPLITSFIFRVRNVPAALYKALGGFATNNINMTKLESYQLDGKFFATQFYADVDGHPEERSLQLAFEELNFFSKEVRILGVYPASPFRKNM